MALWKKKDPGAELGAHVSPAGGDPQVTALLGRQPLDLTAILALLDERRGHVESRAVLVHAVGTDPRLDEVLRDADTDDLRVRLLSAVRLHNAAWERRGRAITSMTAEQQFREFHTALEVAEERLGMLALELPEDEVPLWYALSCARGLERGHEVAIERLHRLREVALTHRRGHSHVLRYLGPKWGGIEEALRDFAWQVSEGHPAGTVLHGLVPEALVEAWVGRLAASGAPDDDAARGLWADKATHQQLGIAWAAYSRCDDLGAPWRVRDLNTFLLTFCLTGLVDPARQVVEALQGRVSDYPWRYLGDDDATVPWRQHVVATLDLR